MHISTFVSTRGTVGLPALGAGSFQMEQPQKTITEYQLGEHQKADRLKSVADCSKWHGFIHMDVV